MVYPERTEFFREYNKVWRQITVGQTPLVNWGTPWGDRRKKLEKKKHNIEFWTQYYKDIYNETYGSTYEHIFAITIRNHCKINNVPLILMSQNRYTKVKFDIHLQDKKYPQTGNGHPTKEGHQIIADDILRLI